VKSEKIIHSLVFSKEPGNVELLFLFFSENSAIAGTNARMCFIVRTTSMLLPRNAFFGHADEILRGGRL